MARKLLMRSNDGTATVYTETTAQNEAELHHLIKSNPELIPFEDLDLAGPLLVVGDESTVSSGMIDLLCLSRTGDVVVVEFKTGPENADFRRVLAQLVDYGSHLWGMSLQDFDERVVHRHAELPLRTLMAQWWKDQTEDERDQAMSALSQQLQTGRFTYVVAAQRFTPTIERTVDYLNATMTSAFFAVELVRFDSEDTSAFESRLAFGPRRGAVSGTTAGAVLDATKFLSRYTDEPYRQAMETFINAVSAEPVLKLQWGPAGVSFRARVAFRSEPVSLGWAFPPGTPVTWMGLRDLTLGFETRFEELSGGIREVLQTYYHELSTIDRATPATAEGMRIMRFDGPALSQSWSRAAEVIAAAATGLSLIPKEPT